MDNLLTIAESLRPAPKDDPPPGRVYSVRLTSDQSAAIDAVAEADGLRASDLLRLALADWLQARATRPPARSAAR